MSHELSDSGLTTVVWEAHGGDGKVWSNSLFSYEKPSLESPFEAAGLSGQLAAFLGITVEDLSGRVSDLDTYAFG